MDREVTQAPCRYRRSTGLVIYWDRNQMVGHLGPVAEPVPLTPESIAILQNLSDRTSAAALRDRIAPGSDEANADGLLQVLHSLGLVEREGEPSPGNSWIEWSPAAAFFHFSTKNGQFPQVPRPTKKQISVAANGLPRFRKCRTELETPIGGARRLMKK